MENMIYVTSASDHTLVVFVPELRLSKTWTKRGQRLPINRDDLAQAYYTPAVETLFKEGLLKTDDVEFMKTVGLMDEEGHTEVVNLTNELLMRMIKLMPVADLKAHLKTLSQSQLNELGDFAVFHYKDLKMDRVDLLTQATGKNILKAIENYKASLEG